MSKPVRPAVEVSDVSIRYKRGDIKQIGLKEYLIRKLTGKLRVDDFWADRHISFALMPGDLLGIVGRNGAGKSTLLKAVARIMEPTEGTIRTRGRISALLELSSGFDKDLTVKENAYLRGAMLGYTRDYMNEVYPDILAFSELEEFEDYPFRQLSSGMQSRLAFSIASRISPDILILDEVLSVGDGQFRKKSAKKMREIISSGATTILVSHSLGLVRSLCNKVLWLNRGEQVEFGDDVAGICDRYEAFCKGAREHESA
ncbi:MAG: ABC transporter ATP-binding protein [Kiritimatiellae bacterium]|nr:ABC transporter ATP-binding protein [Kiritimatiellia bacterium]